MSTRTLHPLADAYLDRLDRAADHLPRARRRELVDDIEAHLVEALGPEPTDADVLNALDRLGTPEEIAEAEGPRPAPRPDKRGNARQADRVAALAGRAWRRRHRAARVPPLRRDGLAPPSGCSEETTGDTLGLVGLVVAIAVPFMTAFYLARRAR